MAIKQAIIKQFGKKTCQEKMPPLFDGVYQCIVALDICNFALSAGGQGLNASL
jgi:hypothetical protein